MKRILKNYPIWLTLLPVLAVMAVIFYFSSETADQSSATSGKVVAWVLAVVMPDFSRRDPAQQQMILQTAGHIIRKLAHFTEFAALGFFLRLHLEELSKCAAMRRLWLWSWGLGTVYAISDECHQFFVGGRAPAVRDICIDSAGVITGTMVMLLLLWLIKKCAGKNEGH